MFTYSLLFYTPKSIQEREKLVKKSFSCMNPLNPPTSEHYSQNVTTLRHSLTVKLPFNVLRKSMSHSRSSNNCNLEHHIFFFYELRSIMQMQNKDDFILVSDLNKTKYNNMLKQTARSNIARQHSHMLLHPTSEKSQTLPALEIPNLTHSLILE